MSLAASAAPLLYLWVKQLMGKAVPLKYSMLGGLLLGQASADELVRWLEAGGCCVSLVELRLAGVLGLSRR